MVQAAASGSSDAGRIFANRIGTVDAQGEIHLEGKGVEPTVKVPVTIETLQQQANGEDVILQAAEEALAHQ
jgi:C-terminal processing protease CtpA/Prc